MSDLETMDNKTYNSITGGSHNSDVISLARYLIEYKIGKYSMCAHSGALKRFFRISADHTIRILIVVYLLTLLMSLFYFCN